MICGDLGHKSKDGQPCAQLISSESKGCIWHTSTPEERHAVAMKGAMAALDQSLKKMPLDTAMPLFNSFANIISFTQQMAWLALVGTVDLGRIGLALKAASVARETVGTAVQEKIATALLKLEHGGPAVAFLTRLSEGNPKRLSEVINLKTETKDDGAPIFIDEQNQEAENALRIATEKLDQALREAQRPRKMGPPKGNHNGRKDDAMKTQEGKAILANLMFGEEKIAPSVGKVTSDEIVE